MQREANGSRNRVLRTHLQHRSSACGISPLQVQGQQKVKDQSPFDYPRISSTPLENGFSMQHWAGTPAVEFVAPTQTPAVAWRKSTIQNYTSKKTQTARKQLKTLLTRRKRPETPFAHTITSASKHHSRLVSSPGTSAAAARIRAPAARSTRAAAAAAAGRAREASTSARRCALRCSGAARCSPCPAAELRGPHTGV